MPAVIRDATAAPVLREAFLRLPERVYAGDPRYCAPSLEAQRRALEAPGRRLLVAEEDGGPVARASVQVSLSLQDETGAPLGVMGHFEALNRPAAVAAFFEEAVRWLRERGARRVIGPMDGDTWHRYRLVLGPWDQPPFLNEPYNPPYYPALWEANGFEVAARYASTRVEDLPAVAERLAPRAEAALAAGYRLRPLALDRFDDEIALLYRLSCRIFAGNYLYTAIQEGEFAALYAGARALIDARLVWFVRAPDGDEVGFLFAYPDHFRAVAAMRGERTLLAKLRFLWHRQHAATTVNFKTIGVLPEHRRAGLAGLLFHRGYVEAMALGFRAANHCLFLDDNPSAGLDHGVGFPLRRYALYSRSLA